MNMPSSSSDFYKVLGIPSTANTEDIRRAYKKRSLETHPDRFSVGSQAQREATGNFQEVNNAYYVLSDPTRRREYDATRSSSSSNAGSWWNRAAPGEGEQRRNAESQFEEVFEEMMADEANANAAHATGGGRFYGLLGGASGAVLGFIIANIPGALAGAVAGNRLGAVRDTKGKPVYQVFQEMPHAEKARMLTELLSKVMS